MENIAEELLEPSEPLAAGPPLFWHNAGRKKDNLVLLTDTALLLASVAPTRLSEVEDGLEAGEDLDELLGGKFVELPLESLVRLQYRRAGAQPSTSLDVYYFDRAHEKKQSVEFSDAQQRDRCAKELSSRLRWKAHEEKQGGWLRLKRGQPSVTVTYEPD
jgi:hypothetical protein